MINLMQLVIFIATVFIVLLGVLAAYIFLKDPRELKNRYFALSYIPIGIWGIGFVFMTSARDESQARWWFSFMASGWAALMPIFLGMILVMTGYQFPRNRFLRVLRYLPALLMTYVNIYQKVVEGFVSTPLGWAYVYRKDSIWILVSICYMMGHIGAMLILLIRFHGRTKDPIQRKQSGVLILSTLLSVAVFIVVTYGPPFLKLPPLSFLDLLTILVLELGLAYAMVKYGFLVLTPQSAASSILSTMADGLVIMDLQGRIVDANAALYDMLKVEKREIIGRFMGDLASNPSCRKRLSALLAQKSTIRDMEACLASKGEEEFNVSVSASVVEDKFGRASGYVAVLRDISERKRTEKQLHYLATHDVLTDLPNRAVLIDRLDNELVRAKRHGTLIGVLFIDVDNFKNINDVFGHDIGDFVLKLVADTFKIHVREYDIVTRLGGDEFVIALPDLTAMSDCESVVQRIGDSLRQPLDVEGHSIRITLSIGGSIYPTNAETVEELFKCADLALYRVKQSGRNGFQFYSSEIDAEARRSLRLEKDLRLAAESGQLAVNYQPMYSTEEGKLLSMESFLRWNHPELGLLLPEEFIPIAERTGLIIPIGDWVLNEVCGHLKGWIASNIDTVPVTVNVSMKQFYDPDLPDKVSRALAKAGLAPEYIKLEITENTALTDIERTIHTVKRLNEIGVKLIMEDFGSKYSSIAWLKHIDVQAIKINRLITRNIIQHSQDAILVKAMIFIAHSLGMSVVAAGIEGREQLDALLDMNRDAAPELSCDIVQGFLFNRPMNAHEAGKLMEKGERPALR